MAVLPWPWMLPALTGLTAHPTPRPQPLQPESPGSASESVASKLEVTKAW